MVLVVVGGRGRVVPLRAPSQRMEICFRLFCGRASKAPAVMGLCDKALEANSTSFCLKETSSAAQPKQERPWLPEKPPPNTVTMVNRAGICLQKEKPWMTLVEWTVPTCGTNDSINGPYVNRLWPKNASVNHSGSVTPHWMCCKNITQEQILN